MLRSSIASLSASAVRSLLITPDGDSSSSSSLLRCAKAGLAEANRRTLARPAKAALPSIPLRRVVLRFMALLFVGQLEVEHGLHADALDGHAVLDLRVVAPAGDGPERRVVEHAARGLHHDGVFNGAG